MIKPTIKRSACDQCRAKRVRCLRAQDSMAPCARCNYTGARCVTGAPGHPGRPPKHRLASRDSTITNTTKSPPGVSPLEDRQISSNMMHDIVGPGCVIAKPAAHPHSPTDHRRSVQEQPQSDFWAALSDSSAFFDLASIDQNPAPGEEIALLPHRLSSPPSQFQGLLSADDEIDAMLLMGGDSSTALGMDVDPFLHAGGVVLPPTPTLSQWFSAASSLVGFREEIDQGIARVDAYYSEPSKILPRCQRPDRDVENPAESLLACGRKFIGIIQSLTPAAESYTQTEDALSTEVVLLALSSYLAFMRLFDSLFHLIYQHLCQVPRESWISIKVKSVLRIGRFSSLQDMSLKAYGMGILDAIQCQVQTVERLMGIPAEYCLSDKAASTAPQGMLSRPDRTRLFRTVVDQEDVRFRRGSKSYIDSIRASIKESLALLDE